MGENTLGHWHLGLTFTLKPSTLEDQWWQKHRDGLPRKRSWFSRSVSILQPLGSSYVSWRINIKAKYLTGFLLLTHFLIKPKRSVSFLTLKTYVLTQRYHMPSSFGILNTTALVLVLKTEYTHTWNNYKGSLPRPRTIQTPHGPTLH